MIEVKFVSNISDLRSMGTTNFFRCLSETNAKGILNIVGKVQDDSKDSKQQISFELDHTLTDNIDNLITITELLKRINVSECKSNNNLLQEIIKDSGGYIRAETENVDYRRTTTAKAFKIKYITETYMPPEEIVIVKDANLAINEYDLKESTRDSKVDNNTLPTEPVTITADKIIKF